MHGQQNIKIINYCLEKQCLNCTNHTASKWKGNFQWCERFLFW